MRPHRVHIEFDSAERVRLDAELVRVSASVVVQGKCISVLSQKLHLSPEHLRVHHALLRNLQMQPDRIHTVRLRHLPEGFRQLMIHALDRRQVDIDKLQTGKVLPMIAQEPAGLCQNLLSDLHDAAGTFCQRDKLSRRDDAKPGILHSGQSFRADDSSCGGLYDRLQINHQRVFLDGIAERLLHSELPQDPFNRALVHDKVTVDLSVCALFQNIPDCLQLLIDRINLQIRPHLSVHKMQVHTRFFRVPWLIQPPGRLRKKLRYRLLLHMFLLNHDEEAPGSFIIDRTRTKCLPEELPDLAEHLVHLKTAVDLARLLIVAVHESDQIVPDSKVLMFPHHLLERLKVKKHRPALTVQINVVDREIQDHDGKHVEGVHQEEMRERKAEESAGDQDGVADKNPIKCSVMNFCPKMNQNLQSQNQEDKHLHIEDRVQGTAVIAFLVDGKDRPGKQAAQHHQPEHRHQDPASHLIERRHLFPGAYQRNGIGIGRIASRHIEKEIYHVHSSQKPYREILMIHVHPRGNDIGGKCQHLQHCQRDKEPVQYNRKPGGQRIITKQNAQHYRGHKAEAQIPGHIKALSIAM